jgi:hypothetical protein
MCLRDDMPHRETLDEIDPGLSQIQTPESTPTRYLHGNADLAT